MGQLQEDMRRCPLPRLGLFVNFMHFSEFPMGGGRRGRLPLLSEYTTNTKDVMQGKLFQKCIHIFCTAVYYLWAVL